MGEWYVEFYAINYYSVTELLNVCLLQTVCLNVQPRRLMRKSSSQPRVSQTSQLRLDATDADSQNATKVGLTVTGCCAKKTKWLKCVCVLLSSSWKPILELQSVTCHMESHSVTCHPTQVNALSLLSLGGK